MTSKKYPQLSGFFSLIFAIAALLFTACQQPENTKNPVPEWAKSAIWYQIFPERFANGDPANDPKLVDFANSWPYVVSENWQTHPWTSDWYALQPWEAEVQWKQHFTWAKPGAPNHNINAGARRYGGDLQGVIDRLDYLQKLGITAIYFNPLFESPSLHKYDAAMYHHIDNNFGPNPEKDREIWATENPADPATWQWTSADSLFLQLIQKCHDREIKVIIDGVFNHTGNNFWAFRDVLKNQEKSPFADWYIVHKWDDPATPENEFDYGGWAGVKDLPEFREDENGLVSGPRAHVRAIVQRWMDPNGDGDPSDGIDGWRLDVAEKVDIAFWKDFQKWVKAINPDAYTTGEVWWEDWPNNRMFNAAPWFDGAFDAVMNYRVARAIKHFVIDQKTGTNATGFADSLQTILRDYPFENMQVCMNLMDSHDTDRLVSQIVNPDRWFDHEANPSQNANYYARKPNAEAVQKQILIAGLQMTLPGAPMIYYGDEAGMWGGDDPDCRKPMVWPEMAFEPEIYNFDGSTHAPDSVSFNRQLFGKYSFLIGMRKAHPLLSRGDMSFIATENQPRVLVFSRSLGDETAYVFANSSAESQTVQTSFLPQNSYSDLASPLRKLIPNPQSLTLAPYQLMVLK